MIRLFDIVLSCIAIILFSPVFIIVIVLLRLTGEGEIFYQQTRIGKDGVKFGILKFATMLKDSPNIGPGTITVKNDNRVLPVGRFLRKTKINELPQLINILLGDMSIIGPRPLTPDNFSHYPEAVKEIINSVRPGLSGIGSIVFRDEEALLQSEKDARTFYQETIAPFKGELEIWFVKNQNILLYFRIIVATLICVLFKDAKLHFVILPNLPKPSGRLKKLIKFG